VLLEIVSEEEEDEVLEEEDCEEEAGLFVLLIFKERIHSFLALPKSLYKVAAVVSGRSIISKIAETRLRSEVSRG